MEKNKIEELVITVNRVYNKSNKLTEGKDYTVLRENNKLYIKLSGNEK